MPKIIRGVLAGAVLGAVVLTPPLATAAPVAEVTPAAPVDDRPNIIYIMADDLSSEVVEHMDAVKALRDDGVNFTNYFVATSQCCPSRATYLTGVYPHNNGVRTNNWPSGGFGRYLHYGEDRSIVNAVRSLPPPPGELPYRTAYFGKYLNGYQRAGDVFDEGGDEEISFDELHIPPGFDEVFIAGGNYSHWSGDFTSLGPDGVPVRVETRKRAEKDYFTDVLRDRSLAFIDDYADRPFFMTIAPNAVHHASPKSDPQYIEDLDEGQVQPATGYPAAPRHRPKLDPWFGWDDPNFPGSGDCGGVACDLTEMPQDAPFNTPASPRPDWMPDEEYLEPDIDEIEADWVARLQMAQALDGLVRRVGAKLLAEGVLDNTYIIFGTDNGYHLGQHLMRSGKNTAYDHDSRVPFVILPPPGMASESEVAAMVSSVDLYPTILDMAGGGAATDLDGRSVLPLLVGDESDWRKTIFIEFRRGDVGAEPLAEGETKAPTFQAMRTADYLYVYWSSQREDTSPPEDYLEFYRMTDATPDPAQIDNLVGRPADGGPTEAEEARLENAIAAFKNCDVLDTNDCWDLGLVDPILP